MAESTRVAWQVDHMILNVIVDDLLLAEDQNEVDTSRPHLILRIDPMSRLIVGSFFSAAGRDEQAIPLPMQSPEHAPAENEGIERG